MPDTVRLGQTDMTVVFETPAAVDEPTDEEPVQPEPEAAPADEPPVENE